MRKLIAVLEAKNVYFFAEDVKERRKKTNNAAFTCKAALEKYSVFTHYVT